MNALLQVVRSASPYLAIELLLPGGSIIALLLWLFRRRDPEIVKRLIWWSSTAFKRRLSLAGSS
jgi:hypothetical protein